MNIQEYIGALQWRYACKKFDPNFRLDEECWAALKRSLQLAPSSLGLEPWHFIVAESPEIRERLMEASYGQAQVRDASKYVILCGLRSIEEADLLAHVRRTREVRGTTPEQESASLEKYRGYSAFWENGRADAYIESQVHLAAGFAAGGAAFLGVDTCIIGGLDPVRYDDILGLNGTRYRTVLGMAFGRRSADDEYAAARKVRFEAGNLFSQK